MPNLGDYIGQLVSEMTIARVQADLEAVRVAELYASHPLLKHLPVPHFRLPEVELNVPVVVNDAETTVGGGSARGGITPEDARRSFETVVDRVIHEERLTISPAVRAAMTANLEKAASMAAGPLEVGVDVQRYATALSTAAMASLTPALSAPPPSGRPGHTLHTSTHAPEALLSRLKDESLLELLKIRKPPSRLGVLVHTSHVREAGGTENVTHIRLKLTESGFEWSESEREGVLEKRLIEE